METPAQRQARLKRQALFEELCILMREGENLQHERLQACVQHCDSQLLRMEDENGMTPLEFGLTFGCSSKTLRVLLEADPTLIKRRIRGSLPLHVALYMDLKVETVEFLIAAYPRALSLPRDDGWYALHVLLDSHRAIRENLDLIERVLRINPNAAKEKVDDVLALHMCLRRNLDSNITFAVFNANRFAACVSTAGRTPLQLALEAPADAWIVRCLVLANPSALLKPMVGSGTVAVLFAMRRQLPKEVIEILQYAARRSDDPKARAYVRAVNSGAFTVVYKMPCQVPRLDGDACGQPDAISICVSHVHAGSVKVTARSSETVTALKRRLEPVWGIPHKEQYLELDGRQLLDDAALSTSGVSEGAELLVRARSELLSHTLKSGILIELCEAMLNISPGAARESDRRGEWPLHIALRQGADEAMVMKLLRLNPKAALEEDCRGGVGVYPLNIAIEQNYSVAFIKELLSISESEGCPWTFRGAYNPQRRADLQSWQGRSRLPLHVAIQNGAKEVVELLLAQKCPPHKRDALTGMTALDCALSSRFADDMFPPVFRQCVISVPHILQKEGPSRQRALHFALRHRASVPIVKELCEYGPESLDAVDSDGALPIHHAVTCGASFAVIRELVKRSPRSVNVQDGRGRTPLQLAVTHRAAPGVAYEICKVDRRALDARCPRGLTVVELAVTADAPAWVIQEILSLAPVGSVCPNFLSDNWPSTAAAAEVCRRLTALDPQKQVSTPRSVAWTESGLSVLKAG